MMKIGPRVEQIDRARADVETAKGQMDYAESQLDATVIRGPVSGTDSGRRRKRANWSAQFTSGGKRPAARWVAALA